MLSKSGGHFSDGGATIIARLFGAEPKREKVLELMQAHTVFALRHAPPTSKFVAMAGDILAQDESTWIESLYARGYNGLLLLEQIADAQYEVVGHAFYQIRDQRMFIFDLFTVPRRQHQGVCAKLCLTLAEMALWAKPELVEFHVAEGMNEAVNQLIAKKLAPQLTVGFTQDLVKPWIFKITA